MGNERSGRGKWLENLVQDSRHELRQLRKNPGFATVAILTLALGIGANTAIFSLVYAVLFKSLPVSHPEQLYSFGETPLAGDYDGIQDDFSVFSYLLYQTLRDNTPEFSELTAFSSRMVDLSVRRSGAQTSDPFNGEFVSGNYFRMFGVSASAGRILTEEDDQPGAPPSVVISHRAWQQHFGGDRSLVGSTLIINSHAMTVTGVAPPGFFGDTLRSDPPDFWFPLALEPALDQGSSRLNQPAMHWLSVAGRMRPNQPVSSVRSHLTTELQAWLSVQKGNGTDRAKEQIAKAYISPVPAGGGIGRLRRSYLDGLKLLMAVSGLVLLITCANIANLLLARGAGNRSQMALRVAVGASRGRVVRQLLTEGIVLSFLGGMAGIAVAFLGTRAILFLAFRGAQYVPIDPSPSVPVLVFALLLSLLTGIVFSVAPAWAASHTQPAETMRGSRVTRDRSALPQRSLAVVQAALSLVLLIGAGLLTESLRNMQNQQFGFETQGRYVVKVDPTLAGYTPERLDGLYRQLQLRLQQIPGVVSASFSFFSPMTSPYWIDPVRIEGRPSQPNPSDSEDEAAHDHVSIHYLETVGTRLLRGRTFDEHDTPASRHVAVVNQEFIKKYIPNGDAIGRHVDIGYATYGGNYEIVGVVEDSRYLNAQRPPDPMIYVPLMQLADSKEATDVAYQNVANSIRSIQLRVAGYPANLEADVRRTLSDIDPNFTVLSMMSLEEQVSLSFNNPRLIARITTLYGLLALIVASVGLYGVAAYMVARRTSEIGIRMALGAARSNVVALILRNAMLPIALGLLIGIPVALLGARAIASQLYGVKGYDPMVMAAAIMVLALCALLAGIMPARRAASIDPIRALRME